MQLSMSDGGDVAEDNTPHQEELIQLNIDQSYSSIYNQPTVNNKGRGRKVERRRGKWRKRGRYRKE